MSLEDRFRKAAEDVKNLKQKPNEEELLNIYGLYKQAELGDCVIPKPGFLDFKGKAKWEAWNERKGLLQDAAKEEYVNKAEELVKKYGLNLSSEL